MPGVSVTGKMIKNLIYAALLAAIVSVGAGAAGVRVMDEGSTAVVVRVGGYPFEPFVDGNDGVTPAFLNELNQRQSTFRFEFVPVPSQRRYELLRRGVVDAFFFEMPVWGWQTLAADITTTRAILRGSEVLVARQQDQSKENIFHLSPARKVALTLGYHYAFADFKADQAYIGTKVDAVFGETIGQTLRYLRSGAADLAIMSDIFLYREFMRTPSLKEQLILSPDPDQTYALPLLVRNAAPVEAAELDAILEAMYADGSLQAFFARFGLARLLLDQ